MSVFFSIIFLSFALALDCLAVSIALGCSVQQIHKKLILKIAVLFGFFQSGMAFLGWFLGSKLSSFIFPYHYWLAFLLLFFIGSKIIYQAFKNPQTCQLDKNFNFFTLLILAFATSIDALAAGFSLSLSNYPFLFTLSFIGGFSFVLTLLGGFFGSFLHTLLGNKINFAGGVILILIGVKIFLNI